MKTPHRPLRALIFDVDGTLAETERDGHLPAFNAAFAAHGLPWHWDDALYGELLAVTGGKERIRHFAAQADPARAAAGNFEQLVHNLHRSKTSHYIAHVASGALPLRPGVRDVLWAARAQGVRLAIASTATPASIHALLAANLGAAASGWFEVIGAGDAVAARKPDPAIYRWVLERLNLPAHACLAIEDSAPGLRAAQGAGIPCLVTPSTYSAGQDFAGAVAVIDSLGEISKAWPTQKDK